MDEKSGNQQEINRSPRDASCHTKVTAPEAAPLVDKKTQENTHKSLISRQFELDAANAQAQIVSSFAKGKWQYLYVVLAGFGLLAIVLSLGQAHKSLNDYRAVVHINKDQVIILNEAKELLRFAQNANAPGNNIFDSHNIAKETASFHASNIDFDNQFQRLREIVGRTHAHDGRLSENERALDAIRNSMAQMRQVAEKIFDRFIEHKPDQAAEYMAEMDRQYAVLVSSIENFRSLQSDAMLRSLEEHQVNLESSRQLELAFSATFFLAIAGISIYGTRNNRFVKEALELSNSARKVSAELSRVAESLNRSFLIAEFDLNGNIIGANENLLSCFEYSRSDLLGRHHRMLCDSNLIDSDEYKSFWQTLERGESRTSTVKRVSKTGKEIWLSATYMPIFSENGAITKYVKQAQNITQLKMMENVLAEAQEIAKIGSWKYDLKTGEQTWTTEHYKIFEIIEPQTQETLYNLYRDRIHPEDRAELDRVIDRAMKSGDDFVYNHRVSLDGGARIKHVRGIGKVSRDREGHPIFISGTCQDLSDIVALQEQNEFILKSMGIGIWRLNPVTKELQWDQSLYDLYELDPKDFSGHFQAWESTLSPERKQKAVEELEHALSGRKEFDTTFEILTKSGLRKHIGGKGVVVRNDKNEPTMMFGINWDKTKEATLQASLTAKTQLLDSILENLPEMVFVKDYQDGLRFRYFNAAGKELLGISPDDIIGKNDFDFFPKEQADFFAQKDREVFSVRRVVHIQKEPIQTPNGERWLETYKVPTYKPDGTPDLLIGISKDITEVLKVKEALEVERTKALHASKLASLGEMSAGIAHEINNPLAIIAGTVRVLPKFANDPSRLNERIEIIQKSTERIAKIVRSLKKFSRSSEKSVHSIHALKPLVEEAVTLTEAKAKRHTTKVEVSIESECQILCDEVELEQVLVNLVNNGIDAVKRLNERWVQIKLREDAEHVTLHIRDSGAGIGKDVEGKLFQPFFTTKPVGEGTGLGLSIVKGILDEHHATIGLDRSDTHTSFEIKFPKLGRS